MEGVPIRFRMKNLLPATLLGLTAFASAIFAVAVWTAPAALVSLVLQAGLATVAVKQMSNLKNSEMGYADHMKAVEPWLIALGTTAISTYFAIVTILVVAFGMGGWLPSIISTLGLLAYMLYVLLYQHHKDEPTIYDPFIKKT